MKKIFIFILLFRNLFAEEYVLPSAENILINNIINTYSDSNAYLLTDKTKKVYSLNSNGIASSIDLSSYKGYLNSISVTSDNHLVILRDFIDEVSLSQNERNSIILINPDGAILTKNIAHQMEFLAKSKVDNLVWLAGSFDKNLCYLSSSTNLNCFELPPELVRLSTYSYIRELFSSSIDNSVWVVGKNAIYNFSSFGTLLKKINVNNPVNILAIKDNIIWYTDLNDAGKYQIMNANLITGSTLKIAETKTSLTKPYAAERNQNIYINLNDAVNEYTFTGKLVRSYNFNTNRSLTVNKIFNFKNTLYLALKGKEHASNPDAKLTNSILKLEEQADFVPVVSELSLKNNQFKLSYRTKNIGLKNFKDKKHSVAFYANFSSNKVLLKKINLNNDIASKKFSKKENISFQIRNLKELKNISVEIDVKNFKEITHYNNKLIFYKK